MTRSRPPGVLARSAVARMLKDYYYIGVVTYEGTKNPDGLHPPLISPELFERVQEVLKAHALSGDRAKKHEHYLKGSIFCGHCHERLLYSRIHGNGGIYEYFTCHARRARRNVRLPRPLRSSRPHRGSDRGVLPDRAAHRGRAQTDPSGGTPLRRGETRDSAEGIRTRRPQARTAQGRTTPAAPQLPGPRR